MDDEEVIKWNDLITKLSYNQIYSHKKELLEKYIIKLLLYHKIKNWATKVKR